LGLTAVAVTVTSIEYVHALSLKHDYGAASDPVQQASIRDSYDSTRSVAYAGLGASIGLAAISGGLVTWYAVKTREDAVTVAPVIAPSRSGATLGARVSF
jgi:hypothetical protein